jgi:hypothetical protein
MDWNGDSFPFSGSSQGVSGLQVFSLMSKSFCPFKTDAFQLLLILCIPIANGTNCSSGVDEVTRVQHAKTITNLALSL